MTTRLLRSFLCAIPILLAEAAMSPAQEPRTVVLEPRYNVRVERNVMIPTRDGTRLSADLIRPDAEGQFPAILEYHPYRKDDMSRGGHDAHYYFAQRGFVGVRLDVRGTGGSEGTNTDEYMPAEQLDGYDAVEWLAAQPWSNGAVGMFGTSYGGFTSIQVAMHRPPHLKAIVPMYATDDRYTDDCHYSIGGAMRMYYDVGTYGGFMVGLNALPPLPELAGPDWATLWQHRLEHNEPYILQWMRHQTDGPYWRAASLRPDYDRIECPVFLIGGWRDGYCNTMLRTYTQLAVPKKLLMGPWVHTRPNNSVPGPRIDYLNEVCRFFAHWLRDEDTGIMSEPPVAVYMQEYATPSRTLDITPGHWRNDADFPAEGTSELTFYLSEGSLLQQASGGRQPPDPVAPLQELPPDPVAPRQKPAPDSVVPRPRTPPTAAAAGNSYDEFDYRPTVGLANGYWSAGGISFYLPEDQRADEAFSLVYTSQPVEQELCILGWPRVVLHAASSARVATFVCKLSDVAPDGHSALIVDGNLNATRRESLTDPTSLEPGTVYELDIPMYPTGWVLQPGHRLRLAISGADFPNLWPTPEEARNRIYRGDGHDSRVVLPVVAASTLPAPAFLPPPALTQIVKSHSQPPSQQMLHDQITGAVTLLKQSGGTTVLEDNLGSLGYQAQFKCTANTNDPAQASIVGTHTFTVKREDGEYVVVGESAIRATADTFHIVIDISITRNGRPFFNKRWTGSEPRRLL